ncbi:MAG: tRNA uridine-5-carboxymethylaminomethyl(34) synthesis enzyme MnmG [Candidatus Mcinerneyibacterium aminivorans]|uniref:tRNA uridine 5-carboxymethylaminomethyl modification enzyme MnmG n=1 Tax=Candidatus Mcinerneyibacterium aminivorans TaxID=2703815 RepID=A0A5D0MK80_9BACT|nr:MAG: tRNA uridine-5-carboxymethylaminomethyl(34) synthesis enzyme MnmG [Candidatus Mcinerneyibacterium aminivorans]
MKIYDVIVVGGGHAGIEAALAAHRLNRKVLLLTMNPDKIGEMSCNPSIGGLAKGQIVREIDALGGEMGINIDKTGIQFRLLNTRKGPAVQSPRAQADKKAYSQRLRTILESKRNIEITMELVTELIINQDEIKGVKGLYNGNYFGKTVILTPGTFLKGRLHIGKKVFSGGRLSEQSADSLGKYLKSIGLPVKRLKTGTPARIDGNTINFSVLEKQMGDKNPTSFSFKTNPKDLKKRPQKPCYKTYTNEKTHEIINKNISLSAIHAGNIVGIGPRYCPSIEDKVEKFPEKNRHQIFIEPEGLYTNEYYLNGISTSLPVEIQHKFLHTIKGLEDAKIVRYAYAVEYDYVQPYILKETLESKEIKNLFHAGQINGTSGYEEAAGQGLIAGANAALKTRGEPQITLGRDEAYIGVLIDDLITKGTKEPYRMFTSRAEYRLLLRADNADERLFQKAYKAGLITDSFYEKTKNKYNSVSKEIKKYRETRFYTDSKNFNRFNGKTIYEMLKMPEMDIDKIEKLSRDFSPDIEKAFYRNIEIKAKYSGYIKKELQKIKKFRKMENKKLPIDFDYKKIDGLTNEAVEKLNKYKPSSIGQASRISGITPADISVLIFYFENNE